MTTTTPPVDLTAFREITDGDRAIEVELFTAFILDFGHGLLCLEHALRDTGQALWAAEAHTLKGGASNLGAHDLALLCAEAQGLATPNPDLRLTVLRKIAAEFLRVKAYLEGQSVA